jgi:hypothetical protein
MPLRTDMTNMHFHTVMCVVWGVPRAMLCVCVCGAGVRACTDKSQAHLMREAVAVVTAAPSPWESCTGSERTLLSCL